jgi:hypothetical protein
MTAFAISRALACARALASLARRDRERDAEYAGFLAAGLAGAFAVVDFEARGFFV